MNETTTTTTATIVDNATEKVGQILAIDYSKLIAAGAAYASADASFKRKQVEAYGIVVRSARKVYSADAAIVAEHGKKGQGVRASAAGIAASTYCKVLKVGQATDEQYAAFCEAGAAINLHDFYAWLKALEAPAADETETEPTDETETGETETETEPISLAKLAADFVKALETRGLSAADAVKVTEEAVRIAKKSKFGGGAELAIAV